MAVCSLWDHLLLPGRHSSSSQALAPFLYQQSNPSLLLFIKKVMMISEVVLWSHISDSFKEKQLPVPKETALLVRLVWGSPQKLEIKESINLTLALMRIMSIRFLQKILRIPRCTSLYTGLPVIILHADVLITFSSQMHN